MNEKTLSDVYFEELSKVDFEELKEQLDSIRGYTQEYFEEWVKDYKGQLDKKYENDFKSKWNDWTKSKNDWIDQLRKENDLLKNQNIQLNTKLQYLESLIKKEIKQ
jgi:hypothetical protein